MVLLFQNQTLIYINVLVMFSNVHVGKALMQAKKFSVGISLDKSRNLAFPVGILKRCLQMPNPENMNTFLLQTCGKSPKHAETQHTLLIQRSRFFDSSPRMTPLKG